MILRSDGPANLWEIQRFGEKSARQPEDARAQDHAPAAKVYLTGVQPHQTEEGHGNPCPQGVWENNPRLVTQ